MSYWRDWDRKMPIYKNKVAFFLAGDCPAPLSCKIHCFPKLINLKRKLLVISNFQKSHFLLSVLCGSCLSLSSIISALDLSREVFFLTSVSLRLGRGGGIVQNLCCEASGTRHPHHPLQRLRRWFDSAKQHFWYMRQRMENLCIILPVLLVRSYASGVKFAENSLQALQFQKQIGDCRANIPSGPP